MGWFVVKGVSWVGRWWWPFFGYFSATYWPNATGTLRAAATGTTWDKRSERDETRRARAVEVEALDGRLLALSSTCLSGSSDWPDGKLPDADTRDFYSNSNTHRVVVIFDFGLSFLARPSESMDSSSAIESAVCVCVSLYL